VATGVSVAPPSRRSTRLQPEPPVATESRPHRSSQPSQSSEHESRSRRSPEGESRPRRSSERESRPRRSPERESRPCRSPEDENIGEYLIICSLLYLISYTFFNKTNTLFLFLFLFFIIYVSNYTHKELEVMQRSVLLLML